MMVTHLWSQTSAKGDREFDQAVYLVLATARTVHQIAKLLKDRQTDGELRRFYRHLTVHCVFVRDHIIRVRSMLDQGNMLVDRVLNLFESLVSAEAGPPLETSQRYPRQRALNCAWAALQDQSNAHARLELAGRALNVADLSSKTALQDYREAFEAWEEDVVTEYPEDVAEWSVKDEQPRSRARPEPSCAVRNAAQTVFEALASSANCRCKTAHELGVRLCLGTYRAWELDDEDGFDMFLAANQNWQEAHVQAVRENKVQFAVGGKKMATTTAVGGKRGVDYKPMLVKALCQQIEKVRKTTALRLELRVENGQLFKLRSGPSSFRFSMDKERPPLSLRHFIHESSRSLTEKTKRILAVLLSYAVLHLHGTPWLQPTWNSSQVLFFQTPTSKIPIRPFIQTRLERTGASEKGDTERHRTAVSVQHPDHSDPDGVDPDDLDPDDVEHPVPVLVTLAVMLMELYFATPVEVLARDRGIELPESGTADVRKRFLDITLVFNEYKREIPLNTQFHHAIERCLDHAVWQDEYGHKLDEQTLRSTIYQEVVRRLEDELCDAFDFITIEELDKIAETVDVGSWGRTLQNQPTEAAGEWMATPAPEDALQMAKAAGISNAASISHSMAPPGFLLNLCSATRDSHKKVLTSSPGLSLPVQVAQQRLPVTPVSEYEDARFYDDMKASAVHSRTEIERYQAWRDRYQNVYREYIDPYMEEKTDPSKAPVRIAVLDTGVDETHSEIDTGQIKRKRNWTSKHVKAAHDRDGHGTFTAGLIMDYAPHAELYVAKIAEKTPCSPSIIAEAIKTAVDEWHVDIISMSFGYPTNQLDGYGELEAALLYAHSKSVLMFAAASNDGANRDRAYPARDPHVICVHSTDAAGNRSWFSPTALVRDANIATVGEAVRAPWPVALCDPAANPDCVQVKSGTSYATPIVAGIAAFLLQYARLHLSPEAASRLKSQSKMKDVLVKIAEKTQRSVSRDGYSYVFLSRSDDNLFGRGKEFIDKTLEDLLKR